MITVIIGQRGVGKSSLLKRIQSYFEQRQESVSCIDLDEAIAAAEGSSITQIFEQNGEAYFRNLEKKYFFELSQGPANATTFVAVGGGFNVDWIPSHVRVLWLQRTSDESGRIFFDRPALEKNMAPVEEFLHRSRSRREKFHDVAWEHYLLPEGLKELSDFEEKILRGTPEMQGWSLTLLPENFKSQERWSFFIARRRHWSLQYFEIRDDLLTDQQIDWVLRDIPRENLLWARRRQQIPRGFSEDRVALVDYDVDILDKHEGESHRMLSVHQRRGGETFAELLQRLETFERRGFSIKLAVEIMSFEELQKGHQWWIDKCSQRNFLPRSPEGRWLWYRLWMSTKQKINFFREGRGSAPDQPSLYQCLSRRDNGDLFAALLGAPVEHSFTPIHQSLFFSDFKMAVLPIAVTEKEFSTAMPFLQGLGLRAAAVTSPLKLKAFESSSVRSESAQRQGAVNTLYCDQTGCWHGHNTDSEGFDKLLERARELVPLNDLSSVAVWGGGGTLSLLRKALPGGVFFSVQSGQPREGSAVEHWKPQWVIWASGNFQTEGGRAPPEHWRPGLVVDLNYREDSGGRELAKVRGAQYLSGEMMFYEQAHHQRLFWRPFLEELCQDRKK